jgi:VIT1/CCC1 family predicted Fe2+/Mn2+ transporter
MKHKELIVLYVRNFVFGVEDSLVSTVGLLSGIAAAGMGQRNLVMTGIVLLFVEAFSMAVGSFLSEYSAEEYVAHTEVTSRYSIAAGIVMFVSYFFFGLIPLGPYMLFDPMRAFWVSIVLSLLVLSLLGVASARMFKVNIVKSTARMLFVGGMAIALGIFVGGLIN